MAHKGAQRIRNVAIVGHRGSGKTSLNEALLFEAGVINRLGSVTDGSTVSDSESDEQEREMSISASLSSFEFEDRKINLIDTPGDPSFVADALGALSVCESAVFCVNGVMGVEVSTDRLWQRADELGLARLVFVNMLDRERADFFRTLDSLKDAFGPHVVATEIPIGSEHETRGIVDLIDMKAFEYSGADRGSAKEIEIPAEVADQAQEYREKLMDEVAENSDDLMERYLEGEEISHDEIVVRAQGRRHRRARSSRSRAASPPRTSAPTGCSTRSSSDLPSPAKKGAVKARDAEGDEVEIEPDDDGEPIAYVFKTLADPFAGRINLFRVYSGRRSKHDSPADQRARPRQGAHRPAAGPARQGDEARRRVRRRRHRRRREAEGDALRRRARSGKESTISLPPLGLPGAVMAFAVEAKSKGDEEKIGHGDPPPAGGGPDDRLPPRPADRGADHRRALAGARRGDRRPDEEPLRRRGHPQAAARALSGDDQGPRQGAGPLQEADRRPRPVRRLPHRDRAAAAGRGLRVRQQDQGRRHSRRASSPRSRRASSTRCSTGVVAGYPLRDVRVTLYDGSYHSVDSSEMAFKVAGSMAFKKAAEQAQPTLLEPIMQAQVVVPEDAVGDVIGDLNGRRGRPLGMEPKGTMTEIKAEVPMAEMLNYAPDLRSITGGRGEYTMEFARYEEVPAHLAQKVDLGAATEEEEADAAKA